MEAVATDTPARSATSFRVAIDDSDHTIFRADIHTAHARSFALIVPAGSHRRRLSDRSWAVCQALSQERDCQPSRKTDQWSGDVAYGAMREAPVRTEPYLPYQSCLAGLTNFCVRQCPESAICARALAVL